MACQRKGLTADGEAFCSQPFRLKYHFSHAGRLSFAWISRNYGMCGRFMREP
jgi:hypothetical protein